APNAGFAQGPRRSSCNGRCCPSCLLMVIATGAPRTRLRAIHRLAIRACANQVSGASRTFVVALDHKAVGYYVLVSGAIAVAGSVGRFGVRSRAGASASPSL